MTSVCVLMAVSSLVAFVGGSITENCFTWAVRHRLFQGGSLLHRRSHFADKLLPIEHRKGLGYWLAKRVPHFCWADPDGLIWQYTVKPEWEEKWRSRSLIKAWAALWIYDGQVVQGDEELGLRWGI